MAASVAPVSLNMAARVSSLATTPQEVLLTGSRSCLSVSLAAEQRASGYLMLRVQRSARPGTWRANRQENFLRIKLRVDRSRPLFGTHLRLRVRLPVFRTDLSRAKFQFHPFSSHHRTLQARRSRLNLLGTRLQFRFLNPSRFQSPQKWGQIYHRIHHQRENLRIFRLHLHHRNQVHRFH